MFINLNNSIFYLIYKFIMEFEIINEILTSTVANLFPNRSMHMSYFKSDEDVNKAEIPKSKLNII